MPHGEDRNCCGAPPSQRVCHDFALGCPREKKRIGVIQSTGAIRVKELELHVWTLDQFFIHLVTDALERGTLKKKEQTKGGNYTDSKSQHS